MKNLTQTLQGQYWNFQSKSSTMIISHDTVNITSIQKENTDLWKAMTSIFFLIYH